jgi:xanthine dehydrogenase accessory factor
VIVTDLANPLCVRRLVCFSEAIHIGTMTIEGITARLVSSIVEIRPMIDSGEIPVMIDQTEPIQKRINPLVIVDARMFKTETDTRLTDAPLVIGLGPGFTAGGNCHAVVETNRGGNLGRVFWQGRAEDDTHIPESIGPYRTERVLRAPADGEFHPFVEIGSHVDAGQELFEVQGIVSTALFKGVVRGLLAERTMVTPDMKVGDIDPRDDENLCNQISDKALSVGGGVLEAVLSKPEIRKRLFC